MDEVAEDEPDCELLEACEEEGIEDRSSGGSFVSVAIITTFGTAACPQYDSSSGSEVSELVSEGVGDGEGGDSASCSCR